MADAGATILLEDALALKSLPSIIHTLVHDHKRLAAMSAAALKLAKPDAANQIATEIIELAKSRLN